LKETNLTGRIPQKLKNHLKPWAFFPLTTIAFRSKIPIYEKAAWTALSRVLLNLDEFIVRE
jgi:hypothetical protein